LQRISRTCKSIQILAKGDIGSVKLGDSTTFTVDSYPRRVFQGTIVQVRQSPQTVQNVVTFDAVVGVNNTDLVLMPGMTASTRIIVANKNDIMRGLRKPKAPPP
jgi:HlyD family secretion protein